MHSLLDEEIQGLYQNRLAGVLTEHSNNEVEKEWKNIKTSFYICYFSGGKARGAKEWFDNIEGTKSSSQEKQQTYLRNLRYKTHASELVYRNTINRGKTLSRKSHNDKKNTLISNVIRDVCGK